MLFGVLNRVLLHETVVPLHGKLFRLDIYFQVNLKYLCICCEYCLSPFGTLQVEVSGGRGKPSTIVDKDEGIGKV